ncbi:LexA family protein [Finegoldia magna]|uniref:LexA family protein n=1 Tax=Finegoldia magna TaxID=1260 RepID=UPI000D718D13|nr:S24 family peptidase [Finegoldia magna]MCC3309491.1 helix-turn-helix domain-containing protein [Finegoldia magna]MCC3310213.1 helix-turn-helix domain-containing protein [Finegoldia magna]PWV49925.1 repressor LexA [Finegoldia magna]
MSATIGDRINKKRLEKGMTLEELGRKAGVSKVTIHKYESKVITNIPSDRIEAMARALNVSPAYLMGWNDSPSEDIDISKIPGVIMPVKLKRIPILGSIACGEPLFAEQNYEGYFMLDENLAGADFCLRAKGDSMIEANIFERDLVFFKKTNDVENGTIAAVLIDDEATLKRISKSEDMLILQPCNRIYSPIIIKPEDDKRVLILGEMVGVYSERNK